MVAEKREKLSIREMLSLLLTVQEYDNKLMELEMRKSFFPDLLKQLKQQVEELRENFKQQSDRLVEIKKEIGLLETDLQSERNELKNSQKRLLKVSTNREYDAVQTEIRGHSDRIAEIEQRIIVLMDEQEIIERELDELKEKLADTEKENLSRISEIERNAADIDGVIEKVRAEREHLASRISRRIMRRYDLIRGGQQGVAVVTIVERACGGCRQALPPQRIQEVRAGKLVICENCGRIIVDVERILPQSRVDAKKTQKKKK